ncbi:MAG TPA: pitrilysin family protein [Kofleriaceae bacterium]|nr:pitrilysin family protein [Kofleriaceae bacterium]
MSRLVSLVILVAACAPKPVAVPIPKLPGDGDTNVAKPAPAPTKTVDDPWAGKTDLVAAPAFAPPAKLELPHIDELKLANGLDVMIVKDDRLPVVSVQLAVRAGRQLEPRARLGVSDATANMLVKGSKRHDASGLAKAIDFVGGTITADATFEATIVSCSVLARDLATCLDLVPDIVVQPTFPDAELKKVQDQMLGLVRQRVEDSGALANQHAQNLLWGNDHVRGWMDSELSVGALHRDDLIAWHRDWFVPNNSVLVIAGDVDAKKLKPQLERAFGDWKTKPLPPAPKYHEPGLSGIRIRLVDRPGATQTHIRIGQLGIRHDDPRYFDALVWNYALGGSGLGSRLSKALHASNLKAFGASTSFDHNFERGSFVVQALARSSDALASTKVLLAEVAKMQKDGPTQDEIDAAIANIAGGYGLRFEASSDLGAQLLGASLHGFSNEYVTKFPQMVQAVTLASAKQSAADVLDPHDYVLVLVGDAKDLEPQLQKEGWRYEKVAFTDPITPEVKQPEGPVDPKVAAATHKLLEEALAAKGGKKLNAMKAFHWHAAGTTSTGPQAVPVEVDRTFVLPDKMRIDATLDMQGKKAQVIVAVDGKVGWQQQPDQTGAPQLGDLGPEELPGIDFERWREPELILVKALDPSAKIMPAADETIDGKPQAVVRLPAPVPGLDVVIYIDRKTKMVSRLGFSDGRTNQADDFSDYHEVSGIQIAFKRKSTGGGRTTELTLSKFEVDPKLDTTTFAKPAKPQ